ncbi:hypothetical protein NBRC116595_37040 [Aliiglaciecola sp. NS0011-25]
MSQGKTEPWLCLGDDSKKYVVKRQSATFKGCLYEWIAANLGQRFGLAIPDFSLANIDEELVEFDIDLMIGLGAGVAFASRFKENLQEVNIGIVKKSDRQVLIDLFMFDYWINNGDRTLTVRGGNPNLYWNVVTESLVVIDHNLAFEQGFSIDDHKKFHVSSSIFKGQGDLFTPLFDRKYYEVKFNEVMGDLDGIIDNIPNEWLNEIQDVLGEIDRIRVVLSAFKNDDFWEALK